MSAEVNQQDLRSLEGEASVLAQKMPELMIEAQRVAHTVVHGIHGRRRAGPGETFWQFRQYQHGDAVNQIDWRRSASSDALYIREREWEAAHTMWLWPDMSMSMQFQSNLSKTKKVDRGLVMAFALCELLIKAGERVGLLGLSPAMTTQNATQKMAETLLDAAKQDLLPSDLPPKEAKVSALSECVLLSDCLGPADAFLERCRDLATRGVRGHIVHILDPIEETFPYQGRVEFQSWGGSSSGGNSWAGKTGGGAGEKILFHKAQDIRAAYQDRLAEHKAELKAGLESMRWTYRVHHTDHTAGKLLLNLYTHISGSDRASASMMSGAAV